MLEQIKYWPEAVTCWRPLYPRPGGALAVKNTLLAMKHGFAYALCCTPGRPRRSYIKHRPCHLLYWEGKQRVEPVGIISSQDNFSKQHQKLSFWGLGWSRRTELLIQFMTGRLMDFIPLLWGEKKQRDTHRLFMFQEFEQVTYDWWRCCTHEQSRCLLLVFSQTRQLYIWHHLYHLNIKNKTNAWYYLHL